MRPHLDWSDQSAVTTPEMAAAASKRKATWAVIAAVGVLLLGTIAFFLLRPPTLPSPAGMVEIKADAYPNRLTETTNVGNFWIDQYEVTNARYQEIVSDYDYAAGEDELPAHNLSWDNANDYCQKVNKRLPTEAEWVLAAQGPDGWLYPWGNNGQAVTLPTNLYPVGAEPVNRSFFGVFDMFSNVGEWVDAPFTTVTGKQKIARGSAFDQQRDLSSALPGDTNSTLMIAHMGVRCAADAVEPTTESSLDQAAAQAGVGRDEFKSEDVGWPNDPTGNDLGYHQPDYYHLSAVNKNTPATSFFTGINMDNFILEADLFVDEDITIPSGDYHYGLAFRHDNGRYYAFIINLDEQSWAVLKYLDPSTLETLAAGNNPAINGRGHTTADVEDRLTVIANGPAMTFLIDGEMVAHVNNADIVGGQVGFFAESLSGDLGHFHFDRISLQAIAASENRVMLDSAASLAEAVMPTDTESEIPTPEATVVPEPTVTITPEPSPTAVSITAVSSLGMVPVVISGTYPLGNGQQIEIAPFWLDRYETSNFDYSQYLVATGAEPPVTWSSSAMPDGRGRYPVQGVTWEEANAYCQLADKRLPTEAEWEAAARGPHGWAYPWGDDRNAVSLPTDDTYSVGSHPDNRSYFGVFDMSGNVWEWVDAPHNATTAEQHILRGGNFGQLRDAIEPLVVTDNDSNVIQNSGFRCAASQTTPAPDPDAIVYTFEDFTGDAERGWPQGSETVDGYFIGYHATDFYHVDVSQPNDCVRVFNDFVFTNFMVESVNYIRRTDGDGDYRYGLALTENGHEFYAILISPVQKEWYVVKNSSASMELLASGPANSIDGLSEETADRLYAIVNGRELTFFVDGQFASRITNDDVTVSQVGFVVQTVDEIHVHTHYDSLSFWALPSEVARPLDTAVTPPQQVDFAPSCQGSYANESTLTEWRSHTVQLGETLSSLAALYEVSAQAIMDINSITDPNVIRVGETFLIPPADE
jgi:formylglycine-generating enzyme required for sulfatase activity